MTDTPTPSANSLVKKLAAVMKEVGRIPKSGRNDFHKYDYVTEADLVEAIRSKLADRHVFVFTSVESFTHQGDITEVHTKHEFVDGESDECWVVHGYGQGQDKGDKGGYKAMTGAMKYVLMKNFLVATGDDPEQHVPEKQTKAPAKPAAAPVAAKPRITETKPPTPTQLKTIEYLAKELKATVQPVKTYEAALLTISALEAKRQELSKKLDQVATAQA